MKDSNGTIKIFSAVITCNIKCQLEFLDKHKSSHRPLVGNAAVYNI
jgi:hypothetical protein